MTNILFLLFLSLSVHAQVRVHVVDPDVEIPKNIPGAYEVTTSKDNENYSMPSKAKRDEFFAKHLSISKKMKGWDEVQKDIFWDDLKSLPEQKLLKKYSSIEASTLKSMRSSRP